MAVVAKPFAVGDLVRWTSQAHGVQRQRVGVVAAVVPAGQKPYQHLPPGQWRVMFRDNVTRPRASYLVAIKGEGRGRGMLHHPHTGTMAPWQERGLVTDGIRRTREEIRRTAAVLEQVGVHVDVPAYRAMVPWEPPAAPWWRSMTRREWIIAAWAAPAVLGLLAAMIAGW
jgi:hypothetical protein